MSAPLSISVIIPVYNAGPWLAATLESVLGQSQPPQQVIVVDDGSTDDSAAVAGRFGKAVQLVQQPNGGCAAARNHGVALAWGELLAFLDADDGWLPEKLARQYAALQAIPTLEAVFGQMEQRCTEGMDPTTILFQPLVQEAYNLNTLLIHRQAFQRIGLFNPAFPLTNALEWLWRARRHALVAQILPEVIAWRRIHGENMSIRERAAVHSEYFRLIKQRLTAQRGQGLPPGENG